MKAITVWLPEPVANQLETTAKRRRVRKQTLAREAVEAYLRLGVRPHPGSFLERTWDLVGRFDGPQDLSANAGHLEGLGE